MQRQKHYKTLNEVPDPSQLVDQEIDEIFDGDRIPANFDQAFKHHQANRVGEPIMDDENENQDPERCPCCLKIVKRKLLKITQSTTCFSFLGSGVPLYFDFYKYCVLMLVILFSTSGDYNLITNIVMGANCQKQNQEQLNIDTNQSEICELNLITQISLANKRYDTSLMNLQQILNLVSITIIIMLFQYIRKDQREVDMQCDYKTITPSDYTILVKNIPIEDLVQNSENIENKLQQFFTNYLNDNIPLADDVIEYLEIHTKTHNNYQIPKRVAVVNVCYNLSEINILNSQKEIIIKEKQKYLTQAYKTRSPEDPAFQLIKGEYGDDDLNVIQKKLQEVNNTLKTIYKQYYDGIDIQQKFLGMAFVTFQWEADKEAVLVLNQTTSWGRFFGQRAHIKYENFPLVIEDAPEPNDVNWQNLHITNKEKIIRRSVGYFVILVVLGITSYIIFQISKMQHESKEYDNIIIRKLAQLASLAIILINYLLSYLIKKISEFEGFSTNTGYHISVATISAYAQFINSALVTWLVFTLLVKNYYQEGGLIYNQTYVFIFNTIIPSMLLLLDPFYLYKLAMRQWEHLKDKKSILTQSQLNSLYEDTLENLSDRYASLLKTVFLTAFYASIIPIGIIFSCIGLIFNYWVSKYNVVNKRIFKNSYGYRLSIEMTENLELMLPIYCFSNFWFEYIFTNGAVVSTYGIIGIVIGLVNAVLPMQEFNEGLFQTKQLHTNVHPYRYIKNKLEIDYARVNPATMVKAKEQFVASKSKANKIQIII